MEERRLRGDPPRLSFTRAPSATPPLKTILFLQHRVISACPIPHRHAYPRPLFETYGTCALAHTRAQARARIWCELRRKTAIFRHSVRQSAKAAPIFICPSGQRAQS